MMDDENCEGEDAYEGEDEDEDDNNGPKRPRQHNTQTRLEANAWVRSGVSWRQFEWNRFGWKDFWWN